MKFFESDWCGVTWTDWIPFESPNIDTILPTGPGVYRIRAAGIHELFYIGQTGVNVRERLRTLIEQTLQDPLHMPYNDPHTAAPSLWAWRDAQGLAFSCSAASVPMNISVAKREAFECSLLWHYRQEFGSSTRCNHGRFHANYYKSSNQRDKKRGGKLSAGKINSAWGPSHPPLALHGKAHDQDWMTLSWTPLTPLERGQTDETIPSTPGVCKVLDPKSVSKLRNVPF